MFLLSTVSGSQGAVPALSGGSAPARLRLRQGDKLLPIGRRVKGFPSCTRFLHKSGGRRAERRPAGRIPLRSGNAGRSGGEIAPDGDRRRRRARNAKRTRTAWTEVEKRKQSMRLTMLHINKGFVRPESTYCR